MARFSREFTVRIDANRAESVRIWQEEEGEVGAVVWDRWGTDPKMTTFPSALSCIGYLQKLHDSDPVGFRHLTILELGAGTGVCGIIAAVLGQVRWKEFIIFAVPASLSPICLGQLR